MNRSEPCPWPGDDPLYVAYHDTEWGVPVRDDRALFEKLLLDGFQAGLSWITILKKRDRYIVVYDGFQPEKIARYTQKKLDRLMADPGIVRNRAKIEGSVQNARAFLAIMEETGSFSDYLWRFTDGRTRVNRFRSMAEMPAQTAASAAMAKELKSRGFKFVGPTICYAFMQAVGMVNDHLTGCYRYREINRLSPASSRSPSTGHRK